MVKDGHPLTRAYSIVSANYEGHLEFPSIGQPGDYGIERAFVGKKHNPGYRLA